MKIYNAKIQLCDSELRELIAEAFGVKPKDISFEIVQTQRDGYAVCATITKAVTVYRTFEREEDPDPVGEGPVINSDKIVYDGGVDCEIVLDPETLRKGPCADD